MNLNFAMKWLPWRLFTRYVARARGFIDPVAVYAQLQRFSQPSEVGEPIELLRAGMVFHARGLLNSKVLQHNMDWVWPYWVERQFDPTDAAFLPRAFSITHINLTNRNWTALGYPGLDASPLVDPCGLVTPFWDSWSLDTWIVGGNSNNADDELPPMLLPSRASDVQQHQDNDKNVSVTTEARMSGMQSATTASVELTNRGFVCRLQATVTSESGGWLVFGARPCNPEGVSFIHELALSKDRMQWRINNKHSVTFDQPVEKHIVSDYEKGDVHIHFADGRDQSEVTCPVGMATAAALFKLAPGKSLSVCVDIALDYKHGGNTENLPSASEAWQLARNQASVLQVSNKHIEQLYASARDTLILMTPDDVYAGPYTYRRYWYRDTVFIAHGLLSAGLMDRATDVVNKLSSRQDRSGYFHSQEGEWDSNGQVLWLLHRFSELGGDLPANRFREVVSSGADWIITKRQKARHGPAWAGLLPAGFSAEHLGPNDHYYWDNYWSIAGLVAAANLMSDYGDSEREKRYRDEAESYTNLLLASLERAQQQLPYPAIPAAPTRRLDAGAIGSVVASYPLQLVTAGDERMAGTLNYLVAQCFHDGGFFQDMIHSGVNAYLTLHVAQAMMRAGDPRFADMIESVAAHASDTGHWPEAVHPHTGGGCMGDGHHTWASAEWVAMIRNCFVREEGDSLILGSGLLDTWLTESGVASFGTALTRFGAIDIQVEKSNNECTVSWQADWQRPPSKIVIAVPGFQYHETDAHDNHSCVRRKLRNPDEVTS